MARELSHEGQFHGQGLRITLQRFKSTKKGLLVQPLKFQVAPLDAFSWAQTANFSDFSTLMRGDFSRHAGRGLITFDIRTLVVDYQPAWASFERARPNAPHPQQMAQQLRQLVVVGSPVIFTARSAWWDANDLRIPVTLRSLNVEERGGEIDARYFDISFAEWRQQELDERGYSGKRERDTLPATVEINDKGGCIEVGTGGKKIGPTPCTLQALSAHYYGDPTLWRGIALENGIKDFAPSRGLDELKKNGKQIRKLHIPRLVDKRSGGIEAPPRTAKSGKKN